jgi:hypothetical protein
VDMGKGDEGDDNEGDTNWENKDVGYLDER